MPSVLEMVQQGMREEEAHHGSLPSISRRAFYLASEMNRHSQGPAVATTGGEVIAPKITLPSDYATVMGHLGYGRKRA